MNEQAIHQESGVIVSETITPLESLSTFGSIGLFGGTFDPIHTGHLILAERAREELELDAVLFMPAHIPPHKTGGRHIADGDARLEMIRRAIAGNPAFFVTDIELVRQGVSYTVDSLRQLHTVAPNASLTLLIGSDNARDFDTWREPEEILRMAHIGVWERPGSYFWPEIFADYIAEKISAPLIEISSTDIRNRIATGRSVRYLTPDPVVDYLEHHGIYR